MDWNHMGSYSSPIVISDDEDDAYVELQLEDRLSDAVFDDGFDDVPYYEEENLEPIMNIRDYELGDYYEDEERYQIYSAPLKRKRSESFEPEPPVISNANLLPPPPPAESKRARKKRLRMEGVLPPVQGKKSKKAKTQQTQAHQPSRPKFVQGSSAPVPEYMPLPPKPLPMGSHYGQLDLPPLPTSVPLSFPPPFPPPMAFPPYNSIMDFRYASLSSTPTPSDALASSACPDSSPATTSFTSATSPATRTSTATSTHKRSF
ncbi:hypothetical protein QCA50_011450 [Cerrena zonata]|uniref:Uncharacterized protein n=1 Tax=Cerrena zonata TaxID=2478898 RepID=A0AAW0FVL1_9APHY